MDILVCMKAVPSTNEINVDGQFRLQRNGAKLQWNIADEAALEAALQLKTGVDTVTILTMGPPKLADSMKELLASGADRAILLSDPSLVGSDTIATAYALSACIRKLGDYSLILCGRRAIDGETGQIPGMLSAALEVTCITNAEKISRENETLVIHRQLDDGIAIIHSQPSLCVSVCEYSYTLRLPGIMGMRRAKDKVIEVYDINTIGISSEKCGLDGSLTRVVKMDSKFPGLRKGPKAENIETGVEKLLSVIQEVANA